MNALRNLVTTSRAALAAAVLVPALLLGGCTDLGEEPFSAVEPENFFRTESEVTAAIVPVYAQLRAMLWAYHNLSQVSSDETIVPTRGSDWADGGRWLSMHRHNWDANLVDLNDAWVAAYTGVARANGVLQSLGEVDNDFVRENRDAISAELRTLRAFYYYQLLDLFGGVPVVGDEEGEFIADPDNPPSGETRQFVYDFIVSELEAVRDQLPDEAAVLGRMTSGAANAMLANLYLNAAVFTQPADGIDTDGYNSCMDTGTCQAAIDAVDRVLDSEAGYALSDSYQAIFTPDNEGNAEHIFVVQHLIEPGLGMSFPMRYLHYNQISPSPWNGFSTISETYNQFDDEDARKDIFLVGPQINFETGQPAQDRNDNPLVFTENCGDINNTTEGACVRVAKFPPDLDFVDGNGHSNDYAFFRLGEMLLIKAEALNELGQTSEAVDLINELRARSFKELDTDEDGETDNDIEDFLLDADDFDQGSLREQILSERLYELIYEAKRRQDLVRYGRFDDEWEYKSASDDFRVLFPIPQLQLDANPNIDQNTGY